MMQRNQIGAPCGGHLYAGFWGKRFRDSACRRRLGRGSMQLAWR